MTSPKEDTPRSELEFPPDRMLELADLAAELVVPRMQGLHDEPAWRGGSRAEFEELMREPPPEEGQSPENVLTRAATEILPVASWVDHPKFFASVPSSATCPGVLADFMATGHNIFQGMWLGASGPSQLEVVVIGWFREWVGVPRDSWGPVHEWWLRSQSRCLRGGSGGDRRTGPGRSCT